MLSDEEREALQYFNTETKTEEMHYGAVLVKLIEKQSKEIEELKNADLTTVYLNGFYDGEKKVKDKIKVKIEELEKQKRQWIEDRDNKHKDSEIIYAIEVLQSLLEKE